MKIKYLKGRNCNCVSYLRSLGYKFPYGLFTLNSKKRIINTQIPRRGAIAIMNASKWGHIGVVQDIKGSIIKILEANYRPCRITCRWGTTRELRILGYYVAKAPKSSQKPIIRKPEGYLRAENKKLRLWIKILKKKIQRLRTK